MQSLALFLWISFAKPSLSITDLDHPRPEEINAMRFSRAVLSLVLMHQMNDSHLVLVTHSWQMMDGNGFICSPPHDI